MRLLFTLLGYVFVLLGLPGLFAMSWARRWNDKGPETFQAYAIAILLTPFAMIGVPFVPVLRFAAFLLDQGE